MNDKYLWSYYILVKMEGRSEFKGMDDNSEFIYRAVYFFLNDLL